MYHYAVFLLIVWIEPVFAHNELFFKKELSANTHWFSYGAVLITLFIILLVLAKYSQKSASINPECKIIERITIHHKTKVYVIAYQGQQFLLADNQNALTIHPIKNNGEEL
jgi:flagellar biogenesis protein FliO